MRSEEAKSVGGDDTGAIAACSVALATLVPVTLYQIGVLKRLPDPPGDVFDSERITMSKVAHPGGIPDGLLGLASFATTMGLLLAARRRPTVRVVLGAKLSLDVGVAGFNAIRQVVRFGKLCSWCTGTALAAGTMGLLERRTIERSWGVVADGWRFAQAIGQSVKAQRDQK